MNTEIKNVLRLVVFALLIGVAGTSCNTARMTIEVLQPPKTELNTKVNEVALINRVDQEDAHTALYVNGEFQENLDGLNLGLQHAALYGIGSALDDYGFFEAGEGKGGNFKTEGRFNGPPLSATELRRLCALYKVKGIIALEGYDVAIYTSGDITRSTAFTRDYGTVYVPSFNGRQEVMMRLFLRFYEKESGKIVFETQMTERLNTSATGNTPDEVEARMPDKVGLAERLAIQMGGDFAQKISPHWKQETRTYFAYGSSQLVRAGNLAQNGFWERATNIWFSIVEDDSSPLRVAKKACFNMILASEVAGDIDLAIAWAERCEEEFGLKRATDYKELLIKRKESLKKFLD